MYTTSRRSTTPLILLLIVLLVATVVAGYAFGERHVPSHDNTVRAEVTVTGDDPLRVTFVGDSLDAGLFASQPGRGFHQLMVASWGTAGSVSDTPLNTLGGTTRDALRNPTFPREQNLVVIELGTNDFAQEDHRAFRQDYEQLLDRLRDASPEAALLCIGPWRPPEAARRFDTIIKDLCEGRGGIFRSVSDLAENSAMKGPRDVMTFSGLSDNFHPNDLGHGAIAERMLDAVSVNRQG